MDTVELKFESTRQDWVAFYFKQFIERQDTLRPLLVWAFVPPAVLIGLTLLITSYLDSGMLRMALRWIAFLSLPLYLSVVYGFVLKKVRAEADRAIKAGKYIGPCEVTLSQQGVSVTRGQSVFRNWNQIPRPTANANYGFLYLSPIDVILIPCRCFSDPKAFEMFIKSVIIFQWHGENALKAAKAAAANPTPEPGEAKPMVIPMLAAAKDSAL
jgi:hypothetical protein